jgi:DNA primase
MFQHKRYLEKRGFDPEELVSLWDIRGIGIGPVGLSWRIWIPITYHGAVVSWTARSISEETKRKYRTAQADEERLNHHDLLYGEDYCRNTAVVFEGVFDVWKFGPGAVCTFGTNWSERQLEKLTKFSRVAVCFDNEATAQRRARKLCDHLSLFTNVGNIMLKRRGQDILSSEIFLLRQEMEMLL